MKLDSMMLSKITDEARRQINNTMKDRHETHEEHLARCWITALLNVVNKDAPLLNLQLPSLSPSVVEPV